jgi:putative membrane protein
MQRIEQEKNTPERTLEQPAQAKPVNPNRTRDHLANERTYLAWMRSAIALTGLGVVIVRLRILRPPIAPQPPGAGWKLGLAFSIVGLLGILFSVQHYFSVRNSIESDTYNPPDREVILSGLVILLLAIGVIYYVFTVPLASLETLLVD